MAYASNYKPGVSFSTEAAKNRFDANQAAGGVSPLSSGTSSAARAPREGTPPPRPKGIKDSNAVPKAKAAPSVPGPDRMAAIAERFKGIAGTAPPRGTSAVPSESNTSAGAVKTGESALNALKGVIGGTGTTGAAGTGTTGAGTTGAGTTGAGTTGTAGTTSISDIPYITGAQVGEAAGAETDPFAKAKTDIENIFANRDQNVQQIVDELKGLSEVRTSAYDKLFGEQSQLSKFYQPAIQAVEEQILDTEGLLDTLRTDVEQRLEDAQVTQSQFNRIEASERGDLVNQMDKLVRSQTRLRAGFDEMLALSEKAFDNEIAAAQDNINALTFQLEQSGLADQEQISLIKAALENDLQESANVAAENRQIASEIRAEQQSMRSETKAAKEERKNQVEEILLNAQDFAIQAGVIPSGGFQQVIQDVMALADQGASLSEMQLGVLRAIGENPQIREFIQMNFDQLKKKVTNSEGDIYGPGSPSKYQKNTEFSTGGTFENKVTGQGTITSNVAGNIGSPAWNWGLDVAGPKGSAIATPVSGKVVAIHGGFSAFGPGDARGKSQNGGFGNQVVVQTNDGKLIFFSHLDSINPDLFEGQEVGMGTKLGGMGNTGYTLGNTGVHLDLTIKEDDGKYTLSGKDSGLWTIDKVIDYIKGKPVEPGSLEALPDELASSFAFGLPGDDDEASSSGTAAALKNLGVNS